MIIEIKDVQTPDTFKNSALEIDILCTEIRLAMLELGYTTRAGSFTIDVHVDDYHVPQS